VIEMEAHLENYEVFSLVRCHQMRDCAVGVVTLCINGAIKQQPTMYCIGRMEETDGPRTLRSFIGQVLHTKWRGQ
jgi:hypothetical protein